MSALVLLGLVTMAGPISFAFDHDTAGWHPRADSVSLRWTAEPGPRVGQRGVLRLEGGLDTGYNYALSPTRALAGGGLYRLTAALCVDRLDPGTPPPSFKAEFAGTDPHVELGRVATEPYDARRLGTWQTLTVEFQLPAAATGVWLALEKNTAGHAGLAARLADVRIDPIERLSALDRYRLQPPPAPLLALRGVHPRLFATAERWQALRQAIGGTHRHVWETVRALADRYVKSGPPPYRERDAASGDEQLWQREVGNALPYLAMAWRLSGERRYLQAAQDWALAACGYPTWGLGAIDGMDLAAGHQLLGLATVYDWCHDELDAPARQTLRETLARRGQAMFAAQAGGKSWSSRAYLQNHLWVSTCGLAAAGLAVWDEVPDAELWYGLTLDKWRTTLASLGPDGASHEGAGYWQYGAEYLLKFMDLAKSLLGVDLSDNAWFRHTAAYCQYLLVPQQAWTRDNVLVDLADCPRGNWYGPEYLLRALAHTYGDGHAQWLAEQQDQAGVCAPGAAWLNVLWYDPAVAPIPPTDLPTLRHFADLGLVSARSGWDGRESLLVLKCGPFIGHEALAKFGYDPGGGHVHPDCAHFVLFAHGRWLLRDDGYRDKRTFQHNTLLVDGHGQIGEGSTWFRGSDCLAAKSEPRILRAESTPTEDLIVADATAAYPAAAGLTRFVRTLAWHKPGRLTVTDEVETDRPRVLELRWHPEGEFTRAADGSWTLPAGDGTLRLRLATPAGVQVSYGPEEAVGRHGAAGAASACLVLQRTAARWRNVVEVEW